MTYTGSRTESFIVRIWFERHELENAPPELRGMLEHVSTGEKHYFTNLADMIQFMLFYLELFNDLREDPS